MGGISSERSMAFSSSSSLLLLIEKSIADI
jgi:hypothetical protein